MLILYRYRLRPKLLGDVSRRDLRTTILGQEIAFPIAVAPTAMQRMAHSEGEVAAARGIMCKDSECWFCTRCSCDNRSPPLL